MLAQRETLRVIILTILCLAFMGVAWAASPAGVPIAAPGTASPWTLWTPVIVAGIPIVMMFFKKLVPPHLMIVIPTLAVVLGPVSDYVLSYLTGKAADPTAGMMYGGLAVALREIVDQFRRASWSPDALTPQDK